MNVKLIVIMLCQVASTMLWVNKASGITIADVSLGQERQELLSKIDEKYKNLIPISSNIGVLGDKDIQFSPSPFADSIRFYSDEEYLYCIYCAEIDNSLERGRLVKRDEDTQSDLIDFKLITQANQFYAYGFQASPEGVMSDYTVDPSFNGDWSWNSDAQISSTVIANTWLVELRIPWYDLRISAKSPYIIGVYVSRFCYQGKKSYRYPYVQYSSGPSFFQNGSPIMVTNPLRKKWKLKVDAYYAALYDSKYNHGNIWYKNIGGNISLKPSSSANLKLSIKPDFSDTPLDSAVDNYNEQNPPQIAENRPFFLEDYDLLAVSQDLWYTRNILSPIFAGKYASVSRDQAVAFLFLRDDPSNKLSGGDFFNALGYCRTFATSKVNLNLYGRQNVDYHNELAYASVCFRPFSSWEIVPIGDISYVKQDSLSSTGFGTGITVSYIQPDYTVSVASKLTDKNFRADMGAFYDQNRTQNTVSFAYDKSRNQFLSRIRTILQWYMVSTLNSGELINSTGNYTQSVYLDENNYIVTLATNYGAEKYLSQWYHPYSVTMGFNCINNTRFTPFASVTAGKAIIYPLSEISPLLSLSGSVTMNINEKLWLNY
ncbi:MAG: hypothetical protein PHO32_09610, partial [Candidatus Cloacimonetes bacterium]|nr:hypothetical protein [Candidatus Cloacimonadota bacterium]